MSRLSVKKQEEIVPVNRFAAYSQRIMYLQQYAKELRLYPSMNNKVIGSFRTYVDKENEIIKKYGKKMTIMDYITNNFQVLFGVLIMAVYVSYRVIVRGELSAGIFVAMFTAVNNYSYSIGSIFSCIPQLTKNGLLSDKVIKMLRYKSKFEGDFSDSRESEKERVFEDIVFNNVSFKYSNSNEYIIKNISFEIKRNDKIAFVGLNGAGKTTIIKLLLRLYDPTDGEILINGQNIRDLGTDEYRSLFQVIFQDFQLYAFTLGENIVMNEMREDDYKKIHIILKQCHLQEFQDEIDSSLTREFDSNGLVPSGGQAQKIAIARALLNNGEITVMDEASSALDPISEYDINHSLVNLLGNQTLVIVSHRLSTVQYVDKIFYVENGMIREQGTHEELIKTGGKYYEMYQKQADSYKM